LVYQIVLFRENERRPLGFKPLLINDLSYFSGPTILDPVIELYRITGDRRYLNLAAHTIKLMEKKDGLRLISEMLKESDLSNVGDGKVYQLCWNLTAIAKLYLMTGDEKYLKTVENAWKNIRDYHLTITGGPWGGIGKHIECFNIKSYWSPYGFVETCSTMSWLQFNREMLGITGDAKYAQEIEKSAYNALIGAQYPNGHDWCYHSFANGRTHTARTVDCCPSSGVLALAELSPVVYSIKENGIACNIFTKSEAAIALPDSNRVKIIQETNYPFDAEIALTLHPEKPAFFPLHIRIPDWANKSEILVNEQPEDKSKIDKGSYFSIRRVWTKGDKVKISFPLQLNIAHQVENSNVPVPGAATIYRIHWFALTRGPLVYSVSGLIGGTDREANYRLPEDKPESYFVPVVGPKHAQGQAYELRLPGHKPLLLLPYFEAAQRKPNMWRLTWIQSAIEQ
jgi:DUF1680 family protein